MAFTATDLTNIESAIITLSTGAGVAAVTFSNGNSVRYREIDMDKLISLRSLIQSELGTTRPRVYAKNGGRATT